MLLGNSFRITVFFVCSTALAACGGLRRLPAQGDDGGGGGMGGSSAGAGGRGGGLVTGGTVGTGGTGGSSSPFDGGPADATFIDSSVVDVPISNCVAGGACVPANACHKGMFVCNEGAMTCMELPDLQANGTVCGADKVCRNGTCS